MLKARNLDDQTYEEIVQAAEGRLPWLCPAWTDHNAHDPGITVLELMAWYKELQQYQMNQFTDGLKWKLLKLAGISPRPAAPAARQYAAAQSPSRQTRPSPTLFQVIICAPSPLCYPMRHTGGAVLRTGSGPVRLFPETGA